MRFPLIALAVTAAAGFGTPPAYAADTACSRSGSSWSTSDPWEHHRYGNYFVTGDNFNQTPDQVVWANSASCFGVATKALQERSGVGSYPHVVRGWAQNDYVMRAVGNGEWPTKSGMGIATQDLTKAKIHWAFDAPTTAGSRWMALIDVYFHRTPNPAAGEFPPAVDLMINQALMDQPLGGYDANRRSYFAQVVAGARPFVVTIGGNKYLAHVDMSSENGFHQRGGHNIHLYQLPTTYTDGTGVNWGVNSATTDLAAIIKFFMQPHPHDDAGHPIFNAASEEITKPMIEPGLYLTAINAGWEIDVGTSFQTKQFWTALQNEPDGP